MKNIPPNVWRTSLSEDDWNFGQTQNDEWPLCLASELQREKIQAEAGGRFPSDIIYEATQQEMHCARICGHPGEDIRDTLQRLGRKPAGKLSKPDFHSYLSWRKAARWKPIPKMASAQAFLISLDWHTVWRHWRNEIENAATQSHAPRIMEGDGPEKTEILPFRIPWGWRNDQIRDAFAEWLMEFRPLDLPEPPPQRKLTGAASYLRQVKKMLKALAAWRLIQHHKGNSEKAYNHPGAMAYLGKAYAHASEWTDAKKTVQHALKQIDQISNEAANFASIQF